MISVIYTNSQDNLTRDTFTFNIRDDNGPNSAINIVLDTYTKQKRTSVETPYHPQLGDPFWSRMSRRDCNMERPIIPPKVYERVKEDITSRLTLM